MYRTPELSGDVTDGTKVIQVEGKSFGKRLDPGKATPGLAVVVGTVSMLGATLMPLLVAVSSRIFELSPASAGRVMAAEMFGFAAGSVIISVLISHTSISRLMLASLLVIIVGNLLTIVLGSETLLPLRFGTGLGEGGGSSAMAAIIAGTATSERYYGISLFAVFLIATAMFRFDPSITAAAGPYAVYWILAAVGLLALPAAFFVRKSAQARQVGLGAPVGARSRTALIAVALVGIIVYFAAWATLWAYAVNIGRWSGLSVQECDVVLSHALIAAMAGAGLAVVIGPRLGNFLPLLAAGTLMAASAILVIVRLTPATFPVAVLSWMVGLEIAEPYMIGVLSQADREGRAASLSFAAQTLGMSIGPALGAIVVNKGSAAILAWLSLILLVPSLVAILAVAKLIGKVDKIERPIPAGYPH